MIKLNKMSKMGERGPGSKSRSRFLPIGMIAGPAGSIVTALLSNWKLAIFGLLIAVIGYQNFMSFELLRPVGLRTVPGVIQDMEEAVEDAQNQVRIMAEQLAECEISRETLKDEIEDTNAEIQKWVDISNELQQSQSELSTALIELQRKSTAEVEIIVQGPIPQTCKGAIKFLRDAVTRGELKWNPSG